MKQSNRLNRVGFAVSFWGAAFVAWMSLLAGNGWITVFQRAAVGFIVLFGVSSFLVQVWSRIAESAQQRNELSETNPSNFGSNESKENASNEIVPGSEPASSDFVPWDFNTPEAMQGFRHMMQDGEGK